MDESTDLPGRTAEGAVIKFTARLSHKETVLCDGFQTTFNHETLWTNEVVITCKERGKCDNINRSTRFFLGERSLAVLGTLPLLQAWRGRGASPRLAQASEAERGCLHDGKGEFGTFKEVVQGWGEGQG